MKKQTLYLIIIGVLLVLNLLQLGFFLAGHKHQNKRPHRDHVRHDLIENLQLNDTQKEQFRLLARDHRDSMKTLGRQHRTLTTAYFDHPSEALMDSIKLLEERKIQLMQKHFSDIQLLLDDEQKQNFKAFKQKVMRKVIR